MQPLSNRQLVTGLGAFVALMAGLFLAIDGMARVAVLILQ